MLISEANDNLTDALAAYDLSVNSIDAVAALGALIAEQPCLVARSYHHQAALRIATSVNEGSDLLTLATNWISTKAFQTPEQLAKNLCDALVGINEPGRKAIEALRRAYAPKARRVA